METFVVQDRYGYWDTIEAEDGDSAVRQASCLEEEANIEYASHALVGVLGKDVMQEEIDGQNEAIRQSFR